ncbi:hypothetical protein DWB61_01180 [Ancylomarina euxinus]|uniref:WG repeat-containing protein n=1 Tax=Ancylomarina euxinus TaxID=2283627 RepID=A0A425Y878_9BACT|nr:hypothetical protein [Ancylomarina euxinus]MCZ4693475.1 hypothetical protein [Ancylomarina euxinus]MUP13702.1 hypothetical protein [Ancylomarina euxinus]RRG24658.1 hypothetical protein DWB61_01180 [Ancylomarina euxinus]
MKFIIIILSLVSSLNICAQKNHRLLEVDHLGSIYTIDGNELKKFSSEKVLISNYSDALLGDITSIDVSNPLRLLLFYKEFNQLLYLDQTLTPISDPIDLYTYSDNETQLCCEASSGGFWIFNKDDNQAFRISKQGEILNKSSLLSPYIKDISPSKMSDFHDKLYFLIPSKGLLILNKFGQFFQQIPLIGISDFCFTNQDLLYLKNKTWFAYKPQAKTDSIVFEMQSPNSRQSKIQANRVYIFYGDQISIKKLKH